MSITDGKCLFVQKEDMAIFKIVGRLRFNTSGGLAAKIEGLNLSPQVQDVVVDMSETDFVDSTVLGLLAQLGKRKVKPIILYEHEKIYKMLRHLGLHKMFILSRKTQSSFLEDPSGFQDASKNIEDTDESIKQRIEKAHKLLYEIDEKNKVEFGEVISCLFKPNE